MKKLLGNDTINIAGHKVPYALLGALAAILGAFLIWKFNQSGGVAVGATPITATPDLTGAGVSGSVTDLMGPPGLTGPPGPPGPPGPGGTAGSAHPGVSDALYAWRKKKGYGSHALGAPPTTKIPAITKTA